MCGAVRILVGVMPVGQAAQRGSTVYFKVEDIRDAASTLEANGVKFSAQPHLVHRSQATELWLAEFTDPDGNHLALMSEVTLAGA
jgi:methylmalonyl-CoA/ethylmalonyl-CoA epimerase